MKDAELLAWSRSLSLSLVFVVSGAASSATGVVDVGVGLHLCFTVYRLRLVAERQPEHS